MDDVNTNRPLPNGQTTADILMRAVQRGHTKTLPYAGEVTAVEAFQLREAGLATIIDVRSAAEYEFVGRVSDTTLIEWNHWPSGQRNPDWLATFSRQVAIDDTVLLLCRSGVRSHAAAMLAAEAGYRNVYNIIDGFEGPRDQHEQRGRLGGWQAAGLPWVQS